MVLNVFLGCVLVFNNGICIQWATYSRNTENSTIKRFNLPTSFSTKPFIAVGSDTGGGMYSFGFEVYISYTTIYSPNSKYGVFCIFIGT